MKYWDKQVAEEVDVLGAARQWYAAHMREDNAHVGTEAGLNRAIGEANDALDNLTLVIFAWLNRGEAKRLWQEDNAEGSKA